MIWRRINVLIWNWNWVRVECRGGSSELKLVVRV